MRCQRYPRITPEELDGLQQGEGMGFAKAAELNHYPGPRHVIDLATDLQLSDAQRQDVQREFDAMQAQARELGERIIEAERHLNMRFANDHIDEDTLRQATSEIAALYGELRFTHLSAHLHTKALLSPEQVAAYDALRGYHTGR